MATVHFDFLFSSHWCPAVLNDEVRKIWASIGTGAALRTHWAMVVRKGQNKYCSCKEVISTDDTQWRDVKSNYSNCFCLLQECLAILKAATHLSVHSRGSGGHNMLIFAAGRSGQWQFLDEARWVDVSVQMKGAAWCGLAYGYKNWS